MTISTCIHSLKRTILGNERRGNPPLFLFRSHPLIFESTQGRITGSGILPLRHGASCTEPKVDRLMPTHPPLTKRKKIMPYFNQPYSPYPNNFDGRMQYVNCPRCKNAGCSPGYHCPYCGLRIEHECHQPNPFNRPYEGYNRPHAECERTIKSRECCERAANEFIELIPQMRACVKNSPECHRFVEEHLERVVTEIIQRREPQCHTSRTSGS